MSKNNKHNEEEEVILTNEQPAEEPTETEAPATEEEVLDEQGELEKKLAEAAEKISILEDKYLRQAAEFDNYRKRTLKEKAEIIKNGGERVIESILPVLDDFERALSTMQKNEEAAIYLTAVELIYGKFVKILEQNGLKKIETKDQAFDTDYHEAIAMVPTPDESLKGKVLDCVQTGYTLNDKVIRHAKVAVGE
ncbi:MAG: nucleotide exchange factor GrpE [Bacteroidaceae bacterium]|nr:nucleotide exchange factor GrpE [Bacteroidaceae bacterium]MBQ3152427.1 nucleotide exchange factor GrpE [Bacteroidaceae bacterium]MBQ4038309.1 nucleotide exchange factor GrpE [Bacteroidaceae bacterium]